MINQAPVIVQNADGLLGVLEHPEALRLGSEARVAVRLTSGRVVLVPIDFMVHQADGSFHVDLSAADVAEFETATEGTTEAEVGTTSAGDSTRGRGRRVRDEGAVVVPVVAESAEVTKRQVESGRVEVRKTVATSDQVVRETLIREDVEVERVPVNRVVDGPVANRQEGDTLIVPVLKEVLVVEKRLMLVEEIRITRRRTEQPFSRTVPLRSETVVVERHEAPAPSAPAGMDGDHQ